MSPAQWIGPILLGLAVVSTHGYTITQPPLPPSVSSNRGFGGDGDDMLLSTITPAERQAILGVWQWQVDHSQSLGADAQVRCSPYAVQVVSLTTL